MKEHSAAFFSMFEDEEDSGCDLRSNPWPDQVTVHMLDLPMVESEAVTAGEQVVLVSNPVGPAVPQLCELNIQPAGYERGKKERSLACPPVPSSCQSAESTSAMVLSECLADAACTQLQDGVVVGNCGGKTCLSACAAVEPEALTVGEQGVLIITPVHPVVPQVCELHLQSAKKRRGNMKRCLVCPSQKVAPLAVQMVSSLEPLHKVEVRCLGDDSSQVAAVLATALNPMGRVRDLFPLPRRSTSEHLGPSLAAEVEAQSASRVSHHGLDALAMPFLPDAGLWAKVLTPSWLMPVVTRLS